MSLQAVVLDLDETLLIEYEKVAHAFRAACALARAHLAERGTLLDTDALYAAVRRTSRALWHAAPERAYALSVGISSWEGLRARFVGDHPSLCALRAWAPTYRRQSWALALGEQGIGDQGLPDALAEVFGREMARPPHFYPDAVGLVPALHVRYRLGLLTNGLPELQEAKIAAAGLTGCVDAIVISGALHVGKPSPAPFVRLLNELQVAPHDAVMVGNSLHADIAGAQGVGMATIWVHRPEAEAADGVTPDVEITDLTELPAALQALGTDRHHTGVG